MIRPIDKSKNNEPKNFCFVTFEKDRRVNGAREFIYTNLNYWILRNTNNILFLRVAKKLIDEGQCVINGHKMMIKQVGELPKL